MQRRINCARPIGAKKGESELPKQLSYAQIRVQIAELETRAEGARQKELAGVVERIREAIAAYSLTAQDLFPARGASGRKAAKAAKPAKRKPHRRNAKSKIKYSDGNGNSWTGHGRRPEWFVTAIGDGKKPEELLVN